MAWTGWNDENTAEAKRLYIDENQSAAQTARAIGAPSRNSIIGKALRMGWYRTRDPHVTRVNRKRAAPAPAPSAKEPKRERRKPKLKLVGFSVMQEPPPRKPWVAVSIADEPGGLTILDPGFGGCRWPLGGEGADTRFCCAKTGGASYCATHTKRAYLPQKTSAKELLRSLRRYA